MSREKLVAGVGEGCWGGLWWIGLETRPGMGWGLGPFCEEESREDHIVPAIEF